MSDCFRMFLSQRFKEMRRCRSQEGPPMESSRGIDRVSARFDRKIEETAPEFSMTAIKRL